MTAFLFVPSPTGAERRVDVVGLTRLFAEVEEAAPRRGDRSELARIAILLLILLGAIGDTMLVARPDALTSCLLPQQRPANLSRAATS